MRGEALRPSHAHVFRHHPSPCPAIPLIDLGETPYWIKAPRIGDWEGPTLTRRRVARLTPMTYAGHIPSIALVKRAAVADTGAAPGLDVPEACRIEGAGRWNWSNFYDEWPQGKKSERPP